MNKYNEILYEYFTKNFYVSSNQNILYKVIIIIFIILIYYFFNYYEYILIF